MSLKTGRSTNICIRQSRLQTYIDQTRQDKHCTLLKGAVHEKDVTIINLYASNVSAPNSITHTLKDLKAHIHSNTVGVGDFNIPQPPTGRSPKQKINKEILELNDTID
jgi:hypothetical protein